MVQAVFVKEKGIKIQSKFHLIKNKIGSKYSNVQSTLFSKFHEANNSKPNSIHVNLYTFKQFVGDSALQRIRLKSFTNSFLNLIPKKGNQGKSKINWTRRRFTGKLISIKIENGLIMEKVFITPKGNIISVSRNSLGLFWWLYK